jgi:hypothetical protein
VLNTLQPTAVSVNWSTTNLYTDVATTSSKSNTQLLSPLFVYDESQLWPAPITPVSVEAGKKPIASSSSLMDFDTQLYNISGGIKDVSLSDIPMNSFSSDGNKPFLYDKPK